MASSSSVVEGDFFGGGVSNSSYIKHKEIAKLLLSQNVICIKQNIKQQNTGKL